LEQRLAAAQQRLDRAGAAVAARHVGGEWEEWEAAHTETLTAERLLAAAKGEEYAEPLAFPVQWDIGAPLPHLFSNGRQTFLTFYVHQPDPNWDGSYVTIKSPSDGTDELLALVQFERCLSVRMGDPNDEVHEGHPLYGKGLRGYTAQLVRNSRWLAELEAVNRVHRCYDPQLWKSLSHYVFWFHDETFECVARAFEVEVYRESMAAMMHRVVHLMLEQ